MTVTLDSRRRLCGVLAVCFVSAFSAESRSAGREEVVITASRIAQELDDELWSSTVLTRQDIEARQANSLQDLLSSLSGLALVNSGGLGKATSVFLRGTESDHIVLLIDGVRVGSATVGIPPFHLIPVEQIERIEVVRGPRSTLYGPDAVGGVIQIFTRRGSRNGLELGGSLSGGSHDTRRYAASARASGERAWLSVSADMLETDGFNACLGTGTPPGGGCFTDEPDRDGFRSKAGSLAAGYRLSDRLSMEFHSLLADGHAESDGTPFSGNRTEFTERVLSLQVDGSLGEAWHARLLLGHNVDDQLYLFEGAEVSRIKATRESVSLQLDGSPAPWLRMIAGADYHDDGVDSDLVYERDSRATVGVFTELHGELGKWSALGGLRLEDNDQFGEHVTGNVGVARSIADRYRLSLTWGTAFRAPTFNELYYPGFGNPDLGPEESTSVELGLATRLGASRWSLNVFHTDIDDLIAFDAAISAPSNIEQARIRGAELQGEWRSDVWQIAGQVTRLDPVNRGNGTTPDRILPRRAKHSASLQLRRIWPSAAVGALARWEGRRYDDLGNTVELGSYFTLDLAAEYSIGRAWKLQARVANLFDRDYEMASYFPQDGRNYSVTIRYLAFQGPGS